MEADKVVLPLYFRDKKTQRYVRRDLVANPNTYKSKDGRVFKKTGKVNHLSFFKRIGGFFKNVGDRLGDVVKSGPFLILLPFKGLMSKALKKRGIAVPKRIYQIAPLFFNNVIAKKNFDGAKVLNFEQLEDHLLPLAIIPPIISFIKGLISGKKPDGSALSADELAMRADALKSYKDLKSKAADSGMSPDDLKGLGVGKNDTTSDMAPMNKYLIYGGGALVVLLIVVSVLKRASK